MKSPIHYVWRVFYGFAISLGYGLIAGGIVYLAEGTTAAREFAEAYVAGFNMLVTTGLIIGTSLVIGDAQQIVPKTIEATFTTGDLAGTGYFEERKRFRSIGRTVAFATEMIALGYGVFLLCGFPLGGLAEIALMIAGCAQWGFASYVGRKLRYTALMLHALTKVEVTRNVFRRRELDIINTVAHAATTLTVLFVYLHVRSYYNAEFTYDGFLGESARVFLLLPAVVATPVLVLFNFFPRTVLRRIYDRSIEIELETLEADLQREELSSFEKRRKLMDFDKQYHDELRYTLQLTIADLPIGLTVVITLVQPLLKS